MKLDLKSLTLAEILGKTGRGLLFIGSPCRASTLALSQYDGHPNQVKNFENDIREDIFTVANQLIFCFDQVIFILLVLTRRTYLTGNSTRVPFTIQL